MRIFKNTTPFPIVLEIDAEKRVVYPNEEIMVDDSNNKEVVKEENINILNPSKHQDIESDLSKRFKQRFGKK